MNKSKIITGIDIGSSKISVVVCQLKSSEDIEILGIGTSVLKGVKKGIICDESLFINALQNCIKRAQASSDQMIEDVFVNVPNGNTAFTIQTGIIQSQSSGQLLTKKDRETAMKKSSQCIDKKNQSILHLIPITQRIDGQSLETFKPKVFKQMEVDTGILLCDSTNLKLVVSNIKKLGMTIKGVISDCLSLGAILVPQGSMKSHLLIDIGAQMTTFCVVSMGQLRFAHTIQIGSEQITQDLAICLKCSISEAERIKVLYGQLQKFQNELSQHVPIQCHNGQQNVKVSLITSIIESRVNQLFQLIQKYLIHAPNYDDIFLSGSGSNLKGLAQWIESKIAKPLNANYDKTYKGIQINSNYMMAMGQIIYGHQIGLLSNNKPSLIKKISNKIFKY
jgi:cell division protein FtsA